MPCTRAWLYRRTSQQLATYLMHVTYDTAIQYINHAATKLLDKNYNNRLDTMIMINSCMYYLFNLSLDNFPKSFKEAVADPLGEGAR